MKMFRVALLAALSFASPAFAQWQTPDHSVPIGNGGGVTGFSNAAPGTASLPLVSNGASADPSFQTLQNSGLATAPARTAKCNPTGSTAAVQDCTPAQLAALGLPVTNFVVNHTTLPSDCGGVIQMGSGSTWPLTLTLQASPLSNGFTAPCAITVTGQASRGVALSGFAGLGLTSPGILWPNKTFSLNLTAAGAWTLTAGDGGRWVLPAAAGSPFPNNATTYTVFIGGTGSSNLNDGLGTGVGAFADLQSAINAASHNFDLNGQNLVFQLADGAYTQANSIHLWSLTGQAVVGGHLEVIIRGNTASLGNVTMAATGAGQHTFAMVGLYPPWRIEGIKFQSTSGTCVSADGQSFLYLGTNDYNVCAGGHVNASYNSFVEMFPPYTISGSAAVHINSSGTSKVLVGGGTITLSGTPNFSTSFAVVNNLGYLEIPSGTNIFSGSATGIRFNCGANSVIQTFGSTSTSYFPGNANNAPASGCVYQ